MTDKVEAKACHTFSATAQQVYDAWLDPAQIRQWMSSALQSHGLPGEIVRLEVDPQVGGKFCFADQRGEHLAQHWGSYLELDRPRKIAFTWIVDASQEDDPSVVTVTLDSMESGCQATVIHQMDAQWSGFVEQTVAGWNRMLAHIDQHLQATESA